MSIRTKGSWSTGGIPRSDRLVTTNMLLSYYHMMMFGTTYRDDGYLISTSEVQAVSDSGKLNPNDSVIPPTPFPTILEELGFSAIKPGLSDVLVDAILNSPLLQREHIYNARTEGLNRTAKKCFGRCWAEILGVSYTKSFDQDSGQLLVMQEGTEQTREYIMTFLTTNGVIDPIRKTLNKEKLQQIIRQKLS